MTCSQAKELIAASWLNQPGFNQAELKQLNKGETADLNRHLETCGDCSAEMAALGGLWENLADMPVPEPSQAMHARWESTLDSLIAERRKPSRGALFANFWPRNPVWQAGLALASLAIGIVVGTNLPRQNQEIAKLHQEIASTREMVALSLLQQQSATERLRGVNYTGRMRTMEPEVVSALIEAVKQDASVNVRLAAIDALSKASGDQSVLQSLAGSLPRQDSPMVQAALVDYLVDARDREALPAIRQLASQPNLNPAVLERTHFALRQLSQ
jgi:hypothetical protein